MAYRNQQANCGYQNQAGTQYGRYQQAVSPARTGGMNMPSKTRDACNVVIVSENENCTASVDSAVLSELPLAMAYVPWQKFENLYCDTEAFKNGTIFKDLDFEFMKRGCN